MEIESAFFAYQPSDKRLSRFGNEPSENVGHVLVAPSSVLVDFVRYLLRSFKLILVISLNNTDQIGIFQYVSAITLFFQSQIIDTWWSCCMFRCSQSTAGPTPLSPQPTVKTKKHVLTNDFT